MTDHQGFTLIELLVVVAIIGVLMGILVPTLGMVMERGKESSCLNEIRQIETALASYESVHRDYPPCRLDEMGIAGNGINEGVESLFLCLTTQKGGPFWEMHEDKLANSDQDEASRTLRSYNDSAIDAKNLYELVDPWQQPYVYIHAKEIHSGYSMRYQVGTQLLDIEPVTQSGKAGIVPGAGKYQIWSFGGDGEDNDGQDGDIVSWRSE